MYFRYFGLLALVFPLMVSAQMSMPMPDGQTMPKPQDNAAMEMKQGGMTMAMGATASLRDNILRHSTSGTDAEPNSMAPPMLMTMHRNWMLMLHGQAQVVEQQQTGLRGHDKLFSTNWVMPMAQRSFGRSELTLRAMLSLEPATISGRYYPELFQQGETAFGRPIVDGQHPHNLFMELAALYDFKIGERGLLSLYAAPVGDPALGPTAYPHRASAGEDPLAPLGHHLEDSTHIADEVVTGGATAGKVRVEASGFHGREPDENRWIISVGGLDSWAARLTIAPGPDWEGQYSIGHLHSPEAQHTGEDVLRQTASMAYHHSWDEVKLDALTLWGRNHTIASAVNWNAYLVEAAAHVHDRHSFWGRVENADRTSDLLGAMAPAEEVVIGRVQAYSVGYAHRIYESGWSYAELGGQYTVYDTPGTLRGLYGDHPQGVAAILNFHLGR